MIYRFLVTLFVAFIAVGSAFSQSKPVRDKHVEAQLISSVSTIKPGEPFTMALKFKIDPTWHTYWINPGDAGKPTLLPLELPPGFTATELQYPVPKKFIIDYGFGAKFGGYGYEKEVLHPFTVTPPDDLAPGSEVTIKGTADWLMCDPEQCVPGKVDLELTLPVGTESLASSYATDLSEISKKIPETVAWPVEVDFANSLVSLKISPSENVDLSGGKLAFHPVSHPVFNILEDPKISLEGGSIQVSNPANESLEATPEEFTGLLVHEKDGVKHGYLVSTNPQTSESNSGAASGDNSSGATPLASAPGSAPFGGGLLGMLLAAFLGGIILNIMPCVFPVISLKVMGFVSQAGEDRKQVMMHSFIFALGILIFFWILTTALVIPKLAGENVGWGAQLQQPIFVIGLIFVMVAVALSLFGVVEFGTSLQGVGGNLAHASGYAGSFWSGALAVLLATPCTAPLMAPAIAFAISQSVPVMYLVFTTLALGLAFPYLLLGAFPKLINSIPAPGAWMETFKQVMGFPMLAVAVWLIGVLSKQLEVNGLQWALTAVLLLAIALWIIGRFARYDASKAKRRSAWLCAILVVAGSFGLAWYASKIRAENTGRDIAAVIAETRADGKHVFVDFTAEWCVNCKINKRIAIKTDQISAAFKENNIELITADWTNEDPRITKVLKEHGRAGVPLYLLYPADKSKPAIQLPDGLIRPVTILEAIKELPKN